MTLEITPLEQHRIDKRGFQVSTIGEEFVVRHPNLKRQKYEGRELTYLLNQAERELDKVGGKANAAPESAGKLPGLTGPNPAAMAAVKRTSKGGTTGGKSMPEVVADDKARAAAKTRGTPAEKQSVPARKPRRARDQEDWKTYQVGRLVLLNPDKSVDELLKLCKDAGIDTRVGTVSGLKRYFALCKKLLADLAKDKKS